MARISAITLLPMHVDSHRADLLGDIMLLQLSIQEVIKVVNNAWGVGLIYFGQKQDTAIWGAGNCIFLARARTSQLTDFLSDNFRMTPPDADSQIAWNRLVAEWRELRATEDFGYMLNVTGDSTLEGLAQHPPDEKAWKNARLAELRRIAPNSPREGLVRQVEADWQGLSERIEKGRVIAQQRRIRAEWSAKDAADDLWKWEERQAAQMMPSGGAKRRPGRAELDHAELIYRLAKAQEAEELKAHDSRMPWKEIAEQIAWKYGKDKAGVKLLEDARHRLKRHKADKEIMKEVKTHREKEKRKMR